MGMPLVTVGVPVYNSAQHLVETLDSIINQSYHNIEVIIADNGSSDNSLEIIETYLGRDPRITCIKSDENIGYSKNVNRIIKVAKGEFISIFHSDDRYHPDILMEEMKFLIDHPNCGGVFTRVNCINENSQLIHKDLLIEKANISRDMVVNLADYLKWITTIGNILICPSGMIRSKIYSEVGYYNESVKLVEDQDMWLRILEVSDLGIIAKPLMDYRIHTKQVSQTYRSLSRNNLNVPLQHLYDYFNQRPNGDLWRDRLSFLIADDYIQIAKRKFLRFQFGQCKQNLERAKSALNGSFFYYSNYVDCAVTGMLVVSLFRAILKRATTHNPLSKTKPVRNF